MASRIVSIRRLVWLTVLLGLGAIYVLVWRPTWLLRWNEYRTGNMIISRVETYRTTHGRLPETLDEIGVGDPDIRVYYKKIGDSDYIVWFGTSLG